MEYDELQRDRSVSLASQLPKARGLDLSAFHFEFDRPEYLWPAAALPLVWWLGRRTLASLGKVRGTIAFLVRSVVWLLFVAACAEMQWVKTDDRLTVIYLLDRSLSVPEGQRRAMIEYVNRSIAEQRHAQDSAGVIAFGRQARVESPPLDRKLRLGETLEATIDPQYSNIAEAFTLAQAAFPEDAAARIVVVTDGNANLGDVYAEARSAVDQGIGVDVVPITYRAQGDVLVEKVSLPAIARRGEPFQVQVLLNNTAEPDPNDAAAGTVGGSVELLRRHGDEQIVISKEHVELAPGKRSLAIRQTLEDADFYVYEARFTPDDPQTDAQILNNKALNFTQVEGAGRVLVIEDFQRQGRHDRLIAALRREKLEVVTMSTNRLFESPAELIGFDTVILADVARTGGDNADDTVTFTDEQIRMLRNNVQEMGCGLVMLGGPNSFGAGGWANTGVEEMMPVDFQIKNVEVVPSGALQLVLDASGSMGGEKLQMCKTAAIAAVKVLSSKDYVGVVAFDTQPHWIVPMHQLKSLDQVVSNMNRLAAGGGTDMRAGVDAGYPAIQGVDAAVKHVILLTDGMTGGTGYEQLAAEMRKQNITTSCVALGADSATTLLDNIARAGGGKFYLVTHPRTIPRIFMKEAMRVARPLIYEKKEGFGVARESAGHEVLRGITGDFPPLTGFVLTRAKRSPLVQTLIANPTFAAEASGTIAATWTYGLGRTAVWTTDCGAAWASRWNDWPEFDRLLGGLVRWTMRPPASGGRYTVHADTDDGRGRIVVTAVDDAGEYLNLLDPQGSVIGPDQKPRPIQLEQVAPGRYAATFDTDEVGSYFLVVRPGVGRPTLRTGVNVSYSPELRDREPNLSLLTSLAALTPKGGARGVITGALSATPMPLAVDFFRHDLAKASGRRDLWPALVLAAVLLFVFDVFVRRVAFEARWLWLPVAWVRQRVLRRHAPVAAAPHMERLKSRKEAVAKQVQDRRATASLKPPPAERPLSEPSASDAPRIEPTPRGTVASSAGAPPSEDYTSRLLKAKRKVWTDRRDGPPPSDSGGLNA
jgi:Mg-chelatase subunit ChlD